MKNVSNLSFKNCVVESAAEGIRDCHAPAEGKRESFTEACAGLRRERSSGRLRPVGNIPALSQAKGDVLGVFYHNDGGGKSVFVATAGNVVAVVRDGATFYLPALRAHPKRLLRYNAGVLLMLDDGAAPVAVIPQPDDPECPWQVEEMPGSLSPLSLVAIDAPALSSQVRGYTFKSTYSSTDTTLAAADFSPVASLLLQAYDDLNALALSSGALLQPVIAYYRLLDRQGLEIYRSAPIVAAASTGTNLASRLEVPLIVDHSTAAPTATATTTIEATPYRLALRCDVASITGPMRALMDVTASIEVMVTPQVHPVDASADGQCFVRCNASAGTLAVDLPGTAIDSSGTPRSLVSPIVGMLARLESATTTEAHIAFDEAMVATLGTTSPINLRRSSTPAADNQAVASVLRNPTDGADDDASPRSAVLLSQCRYPHSFSAEAVATAGDTVVWTGITPRLFSGYSPASMARSCSVSSGTVRSVVQTAGGDRLVRSLSGMMALPTALGPLVCYPLSTARSITVDVLPTGGSIRHIELPLTTIPGCRYAFYLDPSLLPIPISGTAQQLPSDVETRTDLSAPGAIVTANIQLPLHAVDAAVVVSDPIVAVTPAPRRTAAWDYSRALFYLFTGSGIHCLRVGSSLAVGSVNLVDSRRVEHQRHVAMSPDRVFAVAGESLIALTGTKVTTLVDHGVAEAGYCDATGELWVRPSDGPTPRVYNRDGATFYTRSAPMVSTLSTIDGALFIQSVVGALYDGADEQPAATTGVTWRRRIALNPGERLRAIDLDICCSSLAGTLKVTADNGAAAASAKPIVTLQLNGAVDRPVAARVVSPPRRYLNVEFSASVEADFTLGALRLSLLSPRNK